jgi:hypothetical protein
MADLGLTIPHDKGGLTDIEMTSATDGTSHNQVLLSLSGGVHRVPTTSLVAIGVDGKDQTVAGEPAGGKGPLAASTEMKVDTSYENKCLETSLAQKRPPQSSMVTPRISQNFQSKRLIWGTSTPSWMLSKVSRRPVHAVGVGNICVCDGESQESR